MDYSSLPHFCRREGTGSSKHSSADVDNCFSPDHPFHKELYGHTTEESSHRELLKLGSLHVSIPEPDPDDAKIVDVIEAEFHKMGVGQNGSTNGHTTEESSHRELLKMGSLHVSIPEPNPDDAKIVEAIEAEFHKMGAGQNGSTNGHKI